jgi:hypothetical protein
MTRIIALTALVTLGLSGAPVHEPVHAEVLCPVILLLCVTLPRATAFSRTNELGGHGADGYRPLLSALRFCLLSLGHARRR